MPHIVESPYVICIAKTEIIDDNVRAWLGRLNVDEEHKDWLLGVEPYYDTKPDGAILTELAGRRCYMSFQENLNPNVKRIRRDFEDYLDNILESRHGSVLAHTWFTFAIENVSRVLTGELNRHGVGTAISEGSMRFIRYDDIPYWMPKLFQKDQTRFPEVFNVLPFTDPPFAQFTSKEHASRHEINLAFRDMEQHYAKLCDIWKEELAATGPGSFDVKKQLTSAFRRIIGMGVATGGVWSFNIRALRHVIEMRTTKHAEEEVALVGAMLLRSMIDMEPQLFGDFKFDELGFAAPVYSKV